MSTIFDRLKELEQSKRQSGSTRCGSSVKSIKSGGRAPRNVPGGIDAPKPAASRQRFLPTAVIVFGTAVIAIIVVTVRSGGDDADRKIQTVKTMQAPGAMEQPVDDKTLEEIMDETVASIRAMEFVEERTAPGTVEPRGELDEVIVAASGSMGPAPVEEEVEPAEQTALIEQPEIAGPELSEETAATEDIIKAVDIPGPEMTAAEIEPVTAGPVEETTLETTAGEKHSTVSSLIAVGFINDMIAEKTRLLSASAHEEADQEGPNQIDEEIAEVETAEPAIIDRNIGAVEEIAFAQPPLAIKTEINETAEEPTSESAVETVPGPSPVVPPERITSAEDTENKKIINALRKLRFSYLSDSSGRVALLDGKTVREGQKLKNLTVRKIEPSGIIFSCKNKVYRVIWPR